MQLLVLPSAKWWSGSKITVIRSLSITIKHQIPATKEKDCSLSANVEDSVNAGGHDWDGFGPQVLGLTSTFTFCINFLYLQVRFLVDLQRCTEELTSHLLMNWNIIRYITSFRVDSHVTHISGLQVEQKTTWFLPLTCWTVGLELIPAASGWEVESTWTSLQLKTQRHHS